MAEVRLGPANSDQAFAALRLKLAATVARKLRAQESSFASDARSIAMSRGVGYGDGDGGHYLDSFDAHVDWDGQDFPVTFVGTNDSRVAHIIERGAKAHTIQVAEKGPRGGKRRMFFEVDGVLRAAKKVRVAARPAHRVLETAVARAVLRAQR